MTEVVLTTELDAINEMLSIISMAPLNSLIGNNNADVALAKNVLSRVTRQVQAGGWDFNTEEDYPLNRNQDNEIVLSANIMRVDVPRTSIVNVVRRGNRLYDRVSHGFTFTGDLKGKVLLLFTFEDMPQSARDYVAIVSSRIFHVRTLGDDEVQKFTESDEFKALVTLKEEEGDVGNHNIFDSLDTALIVNRYAFIPQR